MEQIKVGDIVRVSENAPKIYQKGSIFNYTERESIVHELDGDAAKIGLDMEDSPIYSAPIIIPTKYLIKVNAEPKEPRYKRGQKVVMPDGDVAIITEVNYNSEHPYSLLSLIDEGTAYYVWGEDRLEPYTEPKAKIEQSVDGVSEEMANELSDAIEAQAKILRIIEDNFDWQRYEADLAREIAVKIVGSQLHSHKPYEVGKMAVDVAKSVVENLKKREE